MAAEAEAKADAGADTALDLTITQAAAAIVAGTVSSASLVSAALARAEERADLHAFTAMDAARALEAARAADAAVAAGNTIGPLHGVPLVVKDNINVAGLNTAAATPALKDFKPENDAPVVAALKAAGAIVIGHTNMHELAMGITGHNAHTGDAACAYDASRFAGGSSSGTGSAVGARIVPGGLGTDTGGSVRIPASLNGCCGLRPTVGRYAQAGIVPLSHTRDTAGPIARSVADLVLLDSVLVASVGDGAASDAVAVAKPSSLSGLRLGIAKDATDNVAPETAAAFTAATTKLAEAGAKLVEVDIAPMRELAGQVGFPVVCWEVVRDLKAYLAASGCTVAYDDVVSGTASADVTGMFGAAVLGDNAIPDAVYEAARDTHRPALQAAYAALFKNHDIVAVLFPTTPLPAGPREAGGDDAVHGTVKLNGADAPVFPTYIRFTDPGSNASLPGVTVPCALAVPADDPAHRGVKLPIGLGMDGPTGSDAALLALALAVEQVLGPVSGPSPPSRD